MEVSILYKVEIATFMHAKGKRLLRADLAFRNCLTGDGEGGNEMTYSLQFLRQYCRIFQGDAAKTRIYFPDQKVHLL